ncbi:thiol-disulfide oxidoreductase DCC family protein [Ascidiimonas sp. W6]|uniref:thiol-disulfide oxidoreductase DCC family protein n=1 Tax=Ascidiimonas meishanensis TaxID=3128903 RepID=UPI0030EDFAF1
MKEVPQDKKIILFDGVCNLCNGAVLYIIKRDRKDVFRFAALQSKIGKKLIEERNIDTEKIDSIILVDPGVAYYTRSTAALEIAKEFGGIWILLKPFEYILPEGVRDGIYKLIAKNRYKWFGKKESCMIPTPALKSKFLEGY